MENLEQIGTRVQGIRQEANYSVEEMAAALGITPEEYISYEKGKTEAPFSFFYKFAEFCNIEISSVLSGEASNLTSYTITRNGEGFSLARKPGYCYLHQAIHMKNRVGEPFVITAPYEGENPELEFLTHSGQEFILVIEGALRVVLKGKEETLNVGDTIYFDGRSAHALTALNPEGCKFLSIVMHTNAEELDEENAAVKHSRSEQLSREDGTLLYQKYMKESWDEEGNLCKVTYDVPENFNFAFDVLDHLAEKEPDKLAMRWISHDKVCKDLSFKDISENSSRTANLFYSLGVRKGDRVMLIVRRHYQFWYLLNALHKLGAVVIPAPVQLLGHDIEYRINKAHVKCVVCTAGDGVCDAVDSVADNTPSLKWKLVVNGERDGWM